MSSSSSLTPLPDSPRSYDDIVSTDYFGNTLTDTTSTEELVNEAYEVIACLQDNMIVKSSIQVKKLLKAMLDNAISDSGRRYVACVIQATRSNQERQTVAQAWLDHLLYPIKAVGRKRTAPPSTEQTPSLQDTATLIESAKRNQKDMREVLRRRQNGRCAVTGNLMDELPEEPDCFHASLEAAHILPFALNNFKEVSTSVHNAALTCDMIRNWCSIDLKNIVGDGINSPANAILLEEGLHTLFGKFSWWFEPTHEANTYIINSRKKLKYRGDTVQFHDLANDNIPLPDPRYLAMHAAFAKVLYTSGAGEYFDKIWYDMDDIGVLSTDGNSDIGVLLSSLYFRPIVKYIEGSLK